jgi:hypothetical protein
MPGYDKKGPDGKGPNTGRGLGYCTGNKSSGGQADETEQRPIRRERNLRGMGRGFGRGLGRGRGFGRRFMLEEIDSGSEGLEKKAKE